MAFIHTSVASIMSCSTVVVRLGPWMLNKKKLYYYYIITIIIIIIIIIIITTGIFI